MLYKVIRVSENYGVVLVCVSENGASKLEEGVDGKYLIYNQHNFLNLLAAEARADDGDFRFIFEETTNEAKILGYFSGQADGLGRGEKPEKPFSSLEELWKWIRDSQKLSDEEIEKMRNAIHKKIDNFFDKEEEK